MRANLLSVAMLLAVLAIGSQFTKTLLPRTVAAAPVVSPKVEQPPPKIADVPLTVDVGSPKNSVRDAFQKIDTGRGRYERQAR